MDIEDFRVSVTRYKLKDGRQRYRYQVSIENKIIEGKSGFLSAKAAKRAHDVKLAELLNNPRKSRNQPTRKWTFDDLVQKFLGEHCAAIRPSTAKRYRHDIVNYIEPYFRYMRLEKITTELIDQFQIDLKEMKSYKGTPLKEKTINNTTDTLRLMFNRAISKKWRLLAVSPFEIEKLPVDNIKHYDWFEDKEDILKLKKTLLKHSPYALVYILVLETGIRPPGEVVGLSKKDVNFNFGKIHVWRQWLERENKYGPCKYDMERFIDFDTKSEFARLLKEAIRKSPDDEIIFLTENGKRPKSSVLLSHFREMCRLAKVKEITCYGLRHTFASHFMIEVDNEARLQYMMGQRPGSNATARYRHHSPRQKYSPLNLTKSEPTAHLPHNRTQKK